MWGKYFDSYNKSAVIIEKIIIKKEIIMYSISKKK
jgi:hypothetical protein